MQFAFLFYALATFVTGLWQYQCVSCVFRSRIRFSFHDFKICTCFLQEKRQQYEKAASKLEARYISTKAKDKARKATQVCAFVLGSFSIGLIRSR